MRRSKSRYRKRAHQSVFPNRALLRPDNGTGLSFAHTPTGPTFLQMCLLRGGGAVGPRLESPGGFVAGRSRHRWRGHCLLYLPWIAVCRPGGGILNGAERVIGLDRFSLGSALRRGSPPLQNNNKTVIGNDERVVNGHLNIGIPRSANESSSERLSRCISGRPPLPGSVR